MTSLEINFTPTTKQDLIFDAFDDNLTTEILYGGAAGTAKSYGICALIILKALEYPGARIGLARNELTTLKKTTVVSFFEVCANWGLVIGEHFTYNSTSGIIKFYNESEIILLELTYKPSDPDFTRLGGHLLTFGVIDELGEVDERGFHIFKSRLGRWKNDDFRIKPIVISTCNPSKNWIYRTYYKPFCDGSLLPHQKFIQALPTDNPYISKQYIENLRRLPFADRERLLHGNWDYDDDKNALIAHKDIINIWDGVPEIPKKEDVKASDMFITADIAFTSDKTVIFIWNKYTIVEIIVNPPGIIEDVILELAKTHNIPQYNITFDSDGVGKFLSSRLRNSRPIVNNARPFKDENYKNLKTQLYFKLAELINSNTIKCKPENHKNEMIEELQVIRHKPSDVVGKLEMVDKGEVRRLIGRSPDFSDAMAYRMIFEYKSGSVKTFRI
jgi:phage terminase large subunit